jgi:hypothetical protein
VSAENDEQQRFAKVTAALQHWRQGDCVVGEHWFVFGIDAKTPLTQEAKEAGESELVEYEVKGFSIVTQTCDIVRSCSTRPFIEISPLVELPPTFNMTSAQRGQLSRYGWLPLLNESRLVVDLDRTMTVEKAVVAGWSRTPGLTTDSECRDFARALARKRQRFAFPDDFVAWTEDARVFCNVGCGEKPTCARYCGGVYRHNSRCYRGNIDPRRTDSASGWLSRLRRNAGNDPCCGMLRDRSAISVCKTQAVKKR